MCVVFAYKHMHTHVSSCSHICLCYSSTSAWLCLLEHHAKINVWGQPSQICELSVPVVFRLTYMCIAVHDRMCVCVCKPRRSLSPGPNLGLSRGDIGFLSPPHMCVSAAMAVIETVGIVCVCLVCCMRVGRMCVLCVCVFDDRWHPILLVKDGI